VALVSQHQHNRNSHNTGMIEQNKKHMPLHFKHETHTHTHTHTLAVASAGLYASLHLAPARRPCQHPTTQFFTDRMPFLPPNQQRQITEGKL